MSKFFTRNQDDYFAQSCQQRFKWQTENPFISKSERELLNYLPIVSGSQVLELGCGTGSNLFNLKAIGKTFSFTGIDINYEEIELAQQKFLDANFMVGDATNVQLPDESFDLVFCRDVIHHINPSEQVKLIQEMTRLTRVGGQVVVIESNGLNFVVWVFGKLVKAEKYLVKSTPKYIIRLIKQIDNLETFGLAPKFVEPWNFFRFILHYNFGLPKLAESQIVCSLLTQMVSLFSKITPSHRWAYMVFTMVRKD
ncbi:MAG: class I SAM-dependent methyltransferase [Nostoc sp. NMS2]|uniref:class I SAM-dependent methyltransferase n=1 Tax=Nostoc sp. NMS2 TaxID=2815389 RepID=UPI0025E47B7B|nr:class I SAM-dependent methyltransferase [Nostoc sp. NMS2]MBN3992489.1 class I SAM-dependent methyltransferase [Nostoc sp. NMS2]